MITIAIVAVISAYAIPAFQDLRVRGRIGAAAEELANSMQLARNTSIVRRRVVLMKHASTSDYNNWVLWMDAQTTGVRLATSSIASPVVITSWVGATTTDLPTLLTFKTAGQVETTSTAGTAVTTVNFRICDNSVNNEIGRDVTISPIGRIAIRPHTDKSVCNP